MRRLGHREALFGGALAIVIATIMLRKVFDFPLEWKLILAGALLFAIAAAISRALHGKTTGFVVTPVESSYEEACKFGGAGATGDF